MKFMPEASIDIVFYKLRGSGKMPPLFSELSTLETPRLVAGILGVAVGLASILLAVRNGSIPILQLPWTTDQRDSPEVVYTVAGLQNLGNNCFLNVVLQALASCGSFCSFLQDVLDADDLESDKKAMKMPLTVTLVALLEELSIIHEERFVLSPRRVMLEMEPYVSTFNLRRQQDAAEAFLLLLSSLEEEVLQCYVPNHGSLVDVSDSPSRVSASRVVIERQSECKRWQECYFGKFDGTVGSILCCKSCSSVEKIRTLRQCIKFDSCLCKSLFLHDGLVWPTQLSHASKQLIIARCPKILCIQLQRASFNPFGEVVKIEGHISFPLVLDLFPFSATANKSMLVNSGTPIPKQVQHQDSSKNYLRNLSMPWQSQLLPMRNFTKEGLSGESHLGDNLGTPIYVPSDDIDGADNTSIRLTNKNNYDGLCIEAFASPTFRPSSEQADVTGNSAHPTSYTYSLTSVVEHYGGSGSGHYAVYRKVMLEKDHEDSMMQPQIVDHFWVYASDHAVSPVSEEAVLGAEASLLFYERNDLVT